MKSKSIFSILLLQFLFVAISQAQLKPLSRDNLSDSWVFGINTGASFGVNSNEQTLFRGSSFATNLFGRYYFGNFGLGVSGGIIPGSINHGEVNKFLVERKFPTDATISNAKPANSYLLFGPSVRFGKRIQFSAEVNGGMFYNDAGGLIVSDQTGQKPLYRFDNGTENLFPGFSGNIHLAYPINQSTHFFINTDYLQTKSSIRLLDPQRGIDVAKAQNRDVKLFTVGVGIIKLFGKTREGGSGLKTGRRKHLAGVKYEDITVSKIGNDNNDLSTGSKHVGNVKDEAAKSFIAGRIRWSASNNISGNNDDEKDGGLADLNVYLIDVVSGGILTTTKTGSDGSFFFSNLPLGNYILEIHGHVSAEKQYYVTVNKKSDWTGQIFSANDNWSIELTTDTGSVETAMRAAKIKSHSNSTNNRMNSNTSNDSAISPIDVVRIKSHSNSTNNRMNSNTSNDSAISPIDVVRIKSHSNSTNNRTFNSNLVWSARSNKILSLGIGDVDGDGVADIIVGNEITDLTGNGASLRPGNPIGGIIVKGGKNPGGSFHTVLTNGNGEFEFKDLDAGNYTFTTDLNYYINDETLITVGNIDVSKNTQAVKSDLQNNENAAAPQNSQPNEKKKLASNVLKTKHDTVKDSINNAR